MHIACKRGNPDVTRVLVQNGALLTCRDRQSNLPIHVACTLGHDSVLAVLITAVADTSARDYYDRTPLHIACEYGRLKLVRRLIQAGVDLNVLDMVCAGRLVVDVCDGMDGPSHERNVSLRTARPLCTRAARTTPPSVCKSLSAGPRC